MSAEVREALSRINEAWLNGRPEAMGEWIHPNVVMVFPGFGGKSEGREAFIGGFREFCETARVIELTMGDVEVDALAATAVASFPFEMLYERAGIRYRCRGRDVWIFTREGERWLAAWRTMLDLFEVPE